MPEDKPDSGTGLPEAGALPMPKFSDAPRGASSAAPVSDELIEKLLAHPKLADQIERGVRRTKDRRFQLLANLSTPEGVAALEKFVKDNGNSVSRGLREYQFEQMLMAGDAQAEPEPSPTPAGKPAAAAASSDDLKGWTAEILTEAGIDWTTDADYQKVANAPYLTPQAFQTAVTKLVARRAKQAALPTGAGAVDNGGAAPGTVDNEQRVIDLTMQIGALLKRPTENADELARLRLERSKLEKK